MADFVGGTMINAEAPTQVVYCGVCSLPPEFCEYGTCYDRCRVWIEQHCPQLLTGEQQVTAAMSKLSTSDENASESTPSAEGAAVENDVETEKVKKPKGGGAAAPKKTALLDTRVIITRVQRQKRKYITVIAGLETVPELKIKDAAKVLGKKFASGASVNEAANGSKEVVIQGDMMLQVPDVIISEFRVAPTAIFFLEDGAVRAFA